MHPKFAPHHRLCPCHDRPCPARCQRWPVDLARAAELPAEDYIAFQTAQREAQARVMAALAVPFLFGG